MCNYARSIQNLASLVMVISPGH